MASGNNEPNHREIHFLNEKQQTLLTGWVMTLTSVCNYVELFSDVFQYTWQLYVDTRMEQETNSWPQNHD
jgi:hypothetical protein